MKKYPLSYQQIELWLHQIKFPDSTAYSLPFIYKIDGDLNVELLDKIFLKLVCKYSSLLTGFLGKESPEQFLREAPASVLDYIDAQDLGEEFCQQKIKHYLSAFNLEKEPAFRFLLLRRSTSSFYLLINFHHIVIDGQTYLKFFQDVSRYYKNPELLTDLSLPIKFDINNWQQNIEKFSAEEWLKAGKYWEKYNNDHMHTALPGSLSQEGAISKDSTAEEMLITFPESLSRQLKTFAAANETSLFRVLLSGFMGTVYRYTGQADIIISYAHDLRFQGDNFDGYYVGLQPIRAIISPECNFQTTLSQIAAGVRNSKKTLPYSYLKFKQPGLREVVTNISFGKTFFCFDTLKLPLLQVELISSTPAPVAGNIDLAVIYDEAEYQSNDENIVFKLGYNAKKFEKKFMSQFLRHFQELLNMAIVQPARPLISLPLLSAEEKKLQLDNFNRTEVALTTSLTVHQLFEKQVKETPDNIAVVFGDKKLTYQELATRVNKLANHLRENGIITNTPVAICFERSLELVIGILAILKAGGAYVPLDPSYPGERLKYMLDDSGSKILLINKTYLQDKFNQYKGKIINLQVDAEIINRQSNIVLSTVSKANDLAYIIYTSGTTGSPKGVCIEHAALTNHMLWMNRLFGFSASDIFIQKTVCSFDASVWEFFAPLILGAPLIVAPEKAHIDPQSLINLINKYNITVLQVVPTMLRLLLQNGNFSSCSSLKHVFCGGEELSKDTIKSFYTKMTAQLHNLYGPTEVTIDSASKSYSKAFHETTNISLIGRPIDNTKAYILDAKMQLLPMGVTGELYLGGAGLARGYLNRPDLTSERFVDNPFATDLDKGKGWTRLYKTGDLCSYLANGDIAYAGRKDNQIKIRGFRIELGEVEQAIASVANSRIRDVCVILHTDSKQQQSLIAYLSLAGFAGLSKQEVQDEVAKIRGYLKSQLPAHMVPAHLICLDKFPLSPNGKINRTALQGRPVVLESAAELNLSSLTKEEVKLLSIWKELLGHEQITLQDNFFDIGGTSLLIVQEYAALPEEWKQFIKFTDLFQYPNIQSLAAYLKTSQDSKMRPTQVRMMEKSSAILERQEIAIIGMSGRFPGANSINEFWHNLRDGRETLGFYSRKELQAAGVPSSMLENPNYITARGIVGNVENFDAEFFHFTPREAQTLDPQQRLFLESAHEALEAAGYNPFSYSGSIGVFAGSGNNYYFTDHLLPNADLLKMMGRWSLATANEKDFLATRASYKLNLTGPAITVQTGCSTSLVAVHLACQSLFLAECDMALAGGVSLGELIPSGYLYQEGMIHSRDGHCRAFDKESSGTVVSQGIGLVVLKRLENAIADRDHIYAIIKGSAINNDGSLKIGFTAPSAKKQAEVIRTALERSGVPADSISYVEAHGTGTHLGDPIELEGLAQVFNTTTREQGSCFLGAIKTNIGHLDAASGVAGLMKAALALYHQQLPATLHFTKFNPKLLENTAPFQINTDLVALDNLPKPLRAGVSSFGLGGTNSHVILESPPSSVDSKSTHNWHILSLSARTETALVQQVQQLVKHLEAYPNINLADCAYTLNVGRRTFPYRCAVISDSLDTAINELKALQDHEATVQEGHRPSVFLFSGQGSQYPEMGRQLYEEEPKFKDTADECLDLLRQQVPKQFGSLSHFFSLIKPENLKRPSFVQPALFIMQYSLAKLMMHWGFVPEAMLGHSQGEYTAACLSEVMKLEDALRLVANRGILTETLPAGRMMSVQDTIDLNNFLLGHPQVDIAAINHETKKVVSGPVAAIEILQKELNERGVKTSILPATFAAHSHLVEPILEAFNAEASQITFSSPKIPYVSSMTGEWVASNPDAKYWTDHLRQPVQFASAIKTLLNEEGFKRAMLLEVSPGNTLSSLSRMHIVPNSAQQIFPLMRHPQDMQSDLKYLLSSMSNIWLSGGSVRWDKIYAGQNLRRIPLPTYPFERKRHWIEKPRSVPSFESVEGLEPATEMRVKANAQKSMRVVKADSTLDIILDIWKNILGFKQVTPQDDYFKLGGDSLQAIQLFAEFKKRFGIELKPKLLFDQSTPQALADLISKKIDKREAVVMQADLESSVLQEHQTTESEEPTGTSKQKIMTSSTGVLKEVLGIWQNILGFELIQSDADYFKLGGDSLQAVQLLNELKKRFNLEFKPNILFEEPTPERLANFIKKRLIMPKKLDVVGNALVPIQKGNCERSPLILIHPVGGDIYYYWDLANSLDSEQPVYAFRATSLDGSGAPFTSIYKMATAYIEELLVKLPRNSYHLGGASFGGIVAYEMAQQLKRRDKKVGSISLIDSPCPGSCMPKAMAGTEDILEYLFKDSLGITRERLAHHTTGRQLELVLQEARILGKGEIFSPDFGEKMLETWMAHLEAMKAYLPTPYNGNVLFFSHTESTEGFSIKPMSAWKKLITGNFQAHSVPGNHISMNKKPNVIMLADQLLPTLTSGLSKLKSKKKETQLGDSAKRQYSVSTQYSVGVNCRSFWTSSRPGCDQFKKKAQAVLVNPELTYTVEKTHNQWLFLNRFVKQQTVKPSLFAVSVNQLSGYLPSLLRKLK